VRQPEFEDGEAGRTLKAKDVKTVGDSIVRKKLTQSSGTVSVDADTLRPSEKDEDRLRSGGSSSKQGNTRSPFLTDDASATSPPVGAVNGHGGDASGDAESVSATNDRSRLESSCSSAEHGEAEAAADARDTKGPVVVEKEKGESFLASLKSMANRSKAARRKSATTSDLPAMMNMIDVNAANAARAAVNNNSASENGGYDSEDATSASGSTTGRESARARDKRDRSDSAKDKLRSGRSGSDGGASVSSGKGKEKEKGDSTTSATSPTTVHHHATKAEKGEGKKAIHKKTLSKRTSTSETLKNS
jgi:hypothetical protein